jgi:DNA primase
VFNLDAQGANWQACILVEGQFDAIAIGGCAYLGSTISDEQAHLLTRLRRKIIVVPDRDSTGLTVCERALELGYTISLPEWSYDIKDVNDAVKKYGRLATTLSILQNATTNKIKLEMMKRRYK